MLHHSGAHAVFVEDAEPLAKVRAVGTDLPELEFVIVIDAADADGGTISLAALRERGQGRAQTELEERVDGVGPALNNQSAHAQRAGAPGGGAGDDRGSDAAYPAFARTDPVRPT